MHREDLLGPHNAVLSPLSIAYTSPGWPLATFNNGIVTSVDTLATTLKAKGHRVSIIAMQVVGETFDESVFDVQRSRVTRSIARRAIDGLWYRAAPRTAHKHMLRRNLLKTIQRAIAEREIEIIEMEESFGWPRWVCEATSIPVCVRLHGPWFLNGAVLGVPDDEAFRDKVREEGRAIKVADAVSAPSRNVLEQVREFYGLALPDAEVIPAPTSPVAAAQRWRLEDCNPKQVLFIGRFDRHKGGDLMIEAFGRVLDAVPEARLLFVGPDRGVIAGNGERWRIEDFARDRIPGALETGQVKWLGNQLLPYEKLEQLRRGAMISVICSRYENFPLTVVEAMARGCPTVAANVGGIPEILQDGLNGLLHRSEDPSDIAAKIIRLLRDPGEAAKLGQRAALDCERQFYPEVVVNRLLEFYRRVLDRKNASRSRTERPTTPRSESSSSLDR
jgi:glycosyltransferase involved in cell wall biosynthesis